MTQGTDRDTPFEGAADRDAADVPDRSGADATADARDAGTGVPRESAAGSDVTRDGAPAGAGAPDDEPSGDVPVEEVPVGEVVDVDEVDVDEPDVDEPEVDEPDVDATRAEASVDRPAGEASEGTAPSDSEVALGDDRPTTVAGPRPLAPPASAPLAAWPSWDDVAVTAPQGPEAGPSGDDVAGQGDDTAPGADTDQGDDTDQGAAADQGHVADEGDVDVAARTDDGSPSSEETGARVPGADEPAPRPLSLGGLSALAFTALNAASVGVPAHALPQSSLTGPDGRTPTDEPTGAEPAEDASSGPSPDGPSPDDPSPDDPSSDGPPAQTPSPDGPAAARPAGEDASSLTDAPTQAVPVVPPAPAWPTTAQGAGDTRPAAGGPVEPTPDARRESSPLDVFEPEDGRRRWPRVLAITGGAVVLVGALYVGASYALADRVPRGTTVAGVQIGAMSSGEAEQVLADGLAERTTAAVPVVAQDVQAELDPAAAGLRFDADATVARLTGVDLTQPVRLWRHLVGVGEQPPVTQVDDDALDASLTQLAGSLTLAPVDGTVVFADGAAHATEAVDGWELDTAGAGDVLVDGWLTEERPVELPTAVVAPAVTQEETQRALTEIAQPLAAAPVTVQVADRQAVLDVPTLTAHAALVPVDGALELQLDGQALTDAVLAQVPDLLTVAADARFEFQDGAPVIVPGTPGTTLDPPTLAGAVGQAATAGTDRVASVELVQSDPAQTTQALEALGVKEIVSDQSTPLTSEPRRTANIAAGLANITGTLVRPGETFSLTEALGPIDAAHGFVQAGAIVNGEHTDAWGGGLSQVSTTTFNAAYFAGYEDVEHTPHSEWFSRYPEGREATIFTGVIDMKWKNNTPYGALVQGFVADGRAHVRIWSTKHFTVETEKSGRSGVVAPTTVYSQSPTCERQSKGNPGFTVTNTRRVYLNGELVDTESDTWRYKPQNEVICGTAPTPGTPPTP